MVYVLTQDGQPLMPTNRHGKVSIISVLFEYAPERAYEIVQGGFTEDNKYNDLLKAYDFRLQKKLNEWLTDKAKSEGWKLNDSTGSDY